jgi:hypothetical protein
MLVTFALILLFAWLLGVAGLYSVGDRVHFMLLVGLLLLLVAFLKARDAAVSRDAGSPPRRQ